MKTIVLPLLSTLLGLFQSRALLHLEILALRQQLAMVDQTPRKRLHLNWIQRLFWVWLYRLWPGCLKTLLVFRPDTLVRWHRKGFRLYWTWKSRCRRGGRPPIPPVVRELIRTMSRDNIGWGAPRIHGELQMLGIEVCQATVAKYMLHHPKPTSQTWRSFLSNHVKELVSVDLFTVPMATFRILYVFLVLKHDRRVVSIPKKLLCAYFSCCHKARTHLALDKICPEPRTVELPDQGTVIAFPHVGGLHHAYLRAA